jgi:TPR repeat protein
MYESRTGVPKSKSEAVKWYGNAAEQGFDPAQDALNRLLKK